MARRLHQAASDRDADPARPRVRGARADGDGNEQARLELLEAHRADVLERLAEVKRNLELIDYKIDLYRSKACR